jgi:hypothetical protein
VGWGAGSSAAASAASKGGCVTTNQNTRNASLRPVPCQRTAVSNFHLLAAFQSYIYMRPTGRVRFPETMACLLH